MPMKIDMKGSAKRNSGYDISPMILDRWSPRAMSGESMTNDELMPLFEAARWAPSAFNEQPWRFIYAKRNTEEWKRFFNLLAEGNRMWTDKAAVLAVIISKKNFTYNNKPSITHKFDAGAAWENLAIEGNRRGLVVHGMSGFDYDKARKDLEIPRSYDILAMIAIGKRGKISNLPESLRKMEFPNKRKPLKDILMKGSFRV